MQIVVFSKKKAIVSIAARARGLEWIKRKHYLSCLVVHRWTTNSTLHHNGILPKIENRGSGMLYCASWYTDRNAFVASDAKTDAAIFSLLVCVRPSISMSAGAKSTRAITIDTCRHDNFPSLFFQPCWA